MPVLVWLMFSILGWLTCNILELTASTESATLFWAKMSYLFVVSTFLTWLAFAFRYTNRYQWLKPARFSWFCVIPLITVILIFTNEMHRLMWEAYTFIPVGNVLAIHIVRYGAWFWINVSYAYILVFLGAALILRQSFKSYNLYRQQSIWLAAGALAPIAGNAIYAFRVIPGLVHDYTSVTFAIAGIAFVIGMTRHRLFDLQPVARDAVIDSMSDAMWALDKQDRIVDLNPAALAFMGVKAGAVLGKPAAQAFAPWSDLVALYRRTLNAQTDIVILDDQRQPRHYELCISPLRDRREHVTGRLIVLRDITDRKAIEVALRERTAELEALNEQLDAFAHTVAHDLKDPLSGVIALASLLKEYFQGLRPEAIADYLDAMTQSTMRLASIVDALLLLASVRRLESTHVEPLDMSKIIANVQSRLSMLIAERQATILVSEDWPVVHSYGPWIEEVWANYVSNAIKYGGDLPCVEVGYSMLETGNPQHDLASEIEHQAPGLQYSASNPASNIQFWVRDNGPGLTAEQQARLFAEYIRLRDAGPGHGLGLSIVRDIVEKLGGAVGVESEVGQGSLFWFTLPVS